MEPDSTTKPPRSWQRLDPGQSLSSVVFFRFCHDATRLLLTLVFRLRSFHARRVPADGGVLLVANHQSHLDPPAIGCVLPHRHIVPIARIGLFKNRLLGWLITRLNSIAINEKEGDAVAIRRAVREIHAGRCILIFPEGSRSHDGEMQELKRGTWVMVSRAKCPVVPVAIEGAFDAWPRSRRFPRLWGRRIAVAFGEPIPFDELAAGGADAGMKRLANEIRSLQIELRERLGMNP